MTGAGGRKRQERPVAADVADSDRLGAWLKGKPPEFACQLAVRAALRVVPVLECALHDQEEDRRRTVLLPSLRALAAARFGSTWPRHRAEVRDAARSAANQAGDTIRDLANGAQLSVVEARDAVPEVDGYVWQLESDSEMLDIAEWPVEAIRLAAQAVVDAIDSERGIASPDAVFESVVSSARAAESAVDRVHGHEERFDEEDAEEDSESEIAEYISEFWNAVALDAECLETGAVSHDQLTDNLANASQSALWLNGTPVWAGRCWADFKDKMPDEEGWRVWIDWYEDRLAGRAANVEFERDMLKIRDDDWSQGPTHVNAIIADLAAAQADPLHTAVSRAFEELDAVKQVTSVNLTQHTNRIRDALQSDPYLAIGATKDMLEGTMKTILRDRGNEVKGAPSFPKLTTQCLSAMGLAGGSEPGTEGERHLRSIASSAKKMIEAANEIRNRAGTGHGRVVGDEPTVTSADASLVASTGLILAAWLLRHAADD